VRARRHHHLTPERSHDLRDALVVGGHQHAVDRAGLAGVPFQAFGFAEEDGWFRLSVGAVSEEDIEAVLPRLREALSVLA